MSEPALLFYDGGCGLCHRAVLFALRRDPDGSRFRFAPLGGRTFDERIPCNVRESLPDSLVLLDEEGVHVRSEAALRVGLKLGGPSALLATGLRLVPRLWRDAAYDLVARLRGRVFSRPARACPLVPDGLRGRFLP